MVRGLSHFWHTNPWSSLHSLTLYYPHPSSICSWLSCIAANMKCREPFHPQHEQAIFALIPAEQITCIFLYACESWTLTAELQWRIQAMEMTCYCKILHISYKDHVTNEEVHAKIQQAVGSHGDLLMIVKRCKLQWYGHVSCSSGLAKTILQGTVKGGRRQGRQKKRLEDNIKEWRQA